MRYDFNKLDAHAVVDIGAIGFCIPQHVGRKRRLGVDRPIGGMLATWRKKATDVLICLGREQLIHNFDNTDIPSGLAMGLPSRPEQE